MSRQRKTVAQIQTRDDKVARHFIFGCSVRDRNRKHPKLDFVLSFASVSLVCEPLTLPFKWAFPSV